MTDTTHDDLTPAHSREGRPTVRRPSTRTALVLKWTAVVSASLLVSAGVASCSLPSQASVDCEFTAVSSDSTFGSDVAVVLAPSANFVDFGNVIDASQALIDEAFGVQGARVSVVLADGKPSLVRSLAPETGDTEDDTHIINRHLMSKIKDVYYCTAGDGTHKVTGGIPVNPEVDMLAALNVAAGSFDPQGEPKNRHIVVLGNGLQTTGQYPLSTKGIPGAPEVNRVVGELKSQGALPNLTGATVDFVGLGVVNADEPTLNQQSLDGLTAFWMAVIAASGGHVGTVLPQVIDGSPSAGSIPTAAVAGLANACINESVAEADGISFQAATADFIDVATATATAEMIAAKIASSGCSGDITVAGYVTAGVSQAQYVFGNPDDQQLSLARAEAFKALLVGAGVSTNIITVGGGKGPLNEWDASGNFVEELGKQNRKVVVTQ